jgi:CDGSH-type Zn-finger protein
MTEAIIKVREQGPLLVTGPVKLVNHLGVEYDTGGKENFVLCRCGNSRQAPFCDGSHKFAEFPVSEIVPAQQP